MNRIYLEFKDDKSSKFWKVEYNEESYTVTYGKIGATGTSKTTECDNPEFESRKQANTKIKKGYVEIKDLNSSIENTTSSVESIDLSLSKEWKEIFDINDNNKRNKATIKIWEKLGFNKIVACFEECLTSVKLECVDEQYKIVYTLCGEVKFYGNINYNVKEDMKEKFGGIDPLLLDLITKLHDGFYSKDCYDYDGYLSPISEMETIEEGCFLDGEYIEEERFDAEEFEEAGIILNEETQFDFVDKTILVARTNHLHQICRNIDHLDYYFDWDTKGDFLLGFSSNFLNDLQNVLEVGLEMALEEVLDEEESSSFQTIINKTDHTDVYNETLKCINGNGVTSNEDEIWQLLEHSYKLGNKYVYANIGYAWQYGKGVPLNYKKAVEAYLKGVVKKDEYCMFNMGVCYRNEIGVESDFNKSLEYYTLARINGHKNAINALGCLYSDDRFSQLNYKKGYELFIEGYNENSAYCSFNVAEFYKDGKYVDVDYEKALFYYKKSVDFGYADAQEKYDELKNKMGNSSSNEIYLEFKDDKSSKFWKVEYNDVSYTVTYGKIGSTGTSKTTNSDNPKVDARKQANAKIKKGYVEIQVILKPDIYDKEECVSIWFTNFEGREIPMDYLEFIYPDDHSKEELSSSVFTREFDLSWYDEDFSESYCMEEETNDYALFFEGHEYEEEILDRLDEITNHLNGQKFTGVIILGDTYCENVKSKSDDGRVVYVGSLDFNELDDEEDEDFECDFYNDAKYCEEKIFVDGLKTVKSKAFSNNTKLKRVVLCDSITSIETDAFSGCVNLEEIILSINLRSIGQTAFSECKMLKRIILKDTDCDYLVDLPKTLEMIGVGAFNCCDSLKEVVIPSLVSEIGGLAFAKCSNLVKITLPNSLKTLNDGIVQQCYLLEEVNIPDSVTEIGGYCFNECYKLRSIKLPSNLKHLGRTAFQQCHSIKEIIIPDGVTTLNQFCFYGCKNLEKITLSNNITKIERSVFSLCTSLKSISLPIKLREIGVYCFDRCESLEQITLPDDVVKINDYIFSKCINLKSITFSNALQHIGEYAFNRCTSLKEINLPNNLEKLGEYAFNRCTNLENIVFSSDLKVLENGLFNYCDSLKNVILSKKINEIGGYCFNNCSKLENVEINSELKTIKIASFQNCSSLIEIKLPMSVSDIEEYAFTGCTNLKFKELPMNLTKLSKYSFSKNKIEKVFISENIMEIDSQVFAHCKSLKEIIVDKKNKKFEAKDGVLYTKGLKCLIIYPNGRIADTFELPKEVETIEYQTFLTCDTIKKFTFNSKIDTIPGWMFDQCNNLEEVIIPNGVKKFSKSSFRMCKSLKSITIPESVEVLDDFCICECPKIEFIKIPKNVKEIGKNLFWGNTNLSKVEVDKDNKNFISIDNVVYNFDKTTIYTIAPDLKVEIFDVLEGVKTIREGSIAHNKHIKTINLPESMESFEVNGIHICDSVECVNVHDSNKSFKSIDGNLYSKDCSKMYFYSVNNKRTEFDIPNTVKSIESDCFFQAKKLTKITIPSSVKEIKQFAFQACTGLKEIYIPDTVNSIGKKVFTQVSDDLTIYLNKDKIGQIDEDFNPLECVIKPYDIKKDVNKKVNKEVNQFINDSFNSIYLEFKDDKSSKFWKVEYTNSSYTVTYGKIGTTGTSKTTKCDNPESEAKKQANAKSKKGYVEINQSNENVIEAYACDEEGYVSVWFGNFSTYEEVYIYSQVPEGAFDAEEFDPEDLFNECSDSQKAELELDFDFDCYLDDHSIWVGILDDATNDYKKLLDESGVFDEVTEKILNLTSKLNGKKFNTVLINTALNTKNLAKESKSGKTTYLGCFEFDLDEVM